MANLTVKLRIYYCLPVVAMDERLFFYLHGYGITPHLIS